MEIVDADWLWFCLEIADAALGSVLEEWPVVFATLAVTCGTCTEGLGMFGLGICTWGMGTVMRGTCCACAPVRYLSPTARK